MSQRYFQELHNTVQPERGESVRVSVRQYVNTLNAKTESMANSYMREFLDEVFSAESACRFFRTFLLRFLFDSSNGSSDDSLNNRRIPLFALALVY